MAQDINRLKMVLAEKKRTNKWLSEQVGKDPATDVDAKDLLWSI